MSNWKLLTLLSPMIFCVAIASAQNQEENGFIAAEEDFVQPTYHYEYIPDFTYHEVNERVDKMDTDMPFELNETIFAFINYFTVRNREYAKMTLARKEIYFPLFEKELKEHGMPEEIKYLAIIESGLNPKAKSRVGAMGLWQFMPATGRVYDLHVTRDIDDRMDPELATEAACRYLKTLHRMFDDWELALAAYNCGPGNVRKAIRRSGGKRTFWGIYNWLPRETRGYIPQFQAIMYVFNHADEHNLILEDGTFPIAHEKVKFDQELDLKRLADISGTCLEELEFLNPAIQNSKIPASTGYYALRVPKAKADYIASNVHWMMDSINLQEERLLAKQEAKKPQEKEPEKLIYKVRRGDALGKIASMYGTTVSEIKTWNGLSSNNIKIGQHLTIYQDGDAFTRNLAADNPSQQDATFVKGTPKTYTVQPGDSLWLIAKKLEGVTIEEIKRLNKLSNNKIKPGQKLIIG
ncbi:LysM peptidoglycan-binding domain-containing protein [Echinicola soli]|uniref:LysM peptidoglycan-binding domain-containing protein n=1 Tax=Echinicola soli TaxID=2591634 RepID=A0A514CMI8_9BACT|nr:lytic transglycosylase domain-containing protein [Echinicola soli]QDH81043.1 LysM peptidoglycan-binding domain-containing protein [Echinicola soli]